MIEGNFDFMPKPHTATPSPTTRPPTTAPTTPPLPTTPQPNPPAIDGEDEEGDSFEIPMKAPDEQNINHRGELFFGDEADTTWEFFVVLQNGNDTDEDVLSRQMADLIRQRAEKTQAIVDMITQLSDDEEVYPAELMVTFSPSSSPADLRWLLLSLLDHPNVDFIERNFKITLFQNQEDDLPWGLDRLDQRALPLDQRFQLPEGLTGEGVNVYVLDTGVMTTHLEFEGRAVTEFTAYDTQEDGTGHGTHVAGIIGSSQHGIARKANLISVKVLDQDGGADLQDLISGINYVSENHRKPAVVNLSLGLKGTSPHIAAAIQKLIDKGLIIISAAGNSNEDSCDWYPGSGLETVNVGATIMANGFDTRSDFSNFGTCVDLFAPGSDIPSLGNTSPTDIVEMSGTSMAAPHVAGVAALYLQRFPNTNQRQFKQVIISASHRGLIKDAGDKSPNRLLNLDLLQNPPPSLKVIQTCQGFSPCNLVQSKLNPSSEALYPAKPYRVSSEAASSFHRGWLIGKGLVLKLLLWNDQANSWDIVGFSETPSEGATMEIINYRGPPGVYTWKVYNNKNVAISYEFQFILPGSKALGALSASACDPVATCNSRGVCAADGKCICKAPYTGPTCSSTSAAQSTNQMGMMKIVGFVFAAFLIVFF